MFFLQATAAPIIVVLGDKVLHVERCDMDYFIQWSNEIASARTEEAIKDLDDTRKAEFKQFYPPIPPDINEMRKLVLTPEGFKRILTTRLSTAKAFKRNPDNTPGPELPSLSLEEIQQLVKINGAGRSAGIAWAIADLVENSMRDPTPVSKLSENGGENPLTSTGTTDAPKSQETGRETSPPSKLSTDLARGESGPSRSSSTASVQPIKSPA
jgi:hypothetical protein